MALIGIDCRFAAVQAGLGTYTRNLVPSLVAQLAPHSCMLFVRNRNEPWLDSIPAKTSVIECSAEQYSIAEQIHFPIIIKNSGIDFLFTPHFNVPYFCPVPFAVTIHDLILHRYPNRAFFLKRFAYRMIIGRAIKNAEAIIAVSDFTAGELSDVYGDQMKDKVTVVIEGLDPLFRRCSQSECAEVLDRYDLKSGYLLYVGNAKEHKNLSLLLSAHKETPGLPELVLVCSGKECAALKLHTGTRLLSNVPEADLPAIFSCARCFVTPSLYEGFCLPVLEARACGLPVIAINGSALPEVAGRHACLIEPTPSAMRTALENFPLEADPITEDMSWVRVAERTAAILRTHLVHG